MHLLDQQTGGEEHPGHASAATEVHGEGNQGGIRKSIRYGTSNQSKCDWVGTWNIAGANTAIALWWAWGCTLCGPYRTTPASLRRADRSQFNALHTSSSRQLSSAGHTELAEQMRERQGAAVLTAMSFMASQRQQTREQWSQKPRFLTSTRAASSVLLSHRT